MKDLGSGIAAGRLARLRQVLAGSRAGQAPRFETSATVLDHYVDGHPNLQNAIDAIPGWVAAMPPETGLAAGEATLYADTRIAWLLERCFVVEGRSVLELGPLEASHTYMLHKAGAAEIDAIEANALAFFRCLVAKEALRLDRASFYLGDFMKWLAETSKTYDLVVASGVLYHSDDPVRLLELICARAESIYLWTHYFDDLAMPRGDLRRVPFSERVETRQCHGVSVRLHERSYYKAWRNPAFCGGLQDRHYWIDRADILALLAAFGFGAIQIADDEPGHMNGPSFSIFAQRNASAR